MNRENIQKVRDRIASLPPERFDMSIYVGADGVDAPEGVKVGEYLRDCGTAACIAGWSIALLAPRLTAKRPDDDAAALLGLEDTAAAALFLPHHKARETIIRAEAVAVLDHLLATGEVDWSVAEQVAA